MQEKAELLAPAGDFIRLQTALLYGADAVYIGGEEFSMRTACDNFSDKMLLKAIEYVKQKEKKIYVAANVIMREKDMEPLARFAEFLQENGADGVIVSDLGAFSVIREAAPKLPIHISTQANITNAASAMAWHNMGATRVVLARELSREEVRVIRSKTPDSLELELFVHGAMCVSYSGRCLLSNYMTGRDANRGDCAQACRWKYALMEEKRPGAYMPIMENERGSYIMNAEDLCLLEFLPEILESGVKSLKIEGRVKSEYYVATVVKAYRQALDRYYENPTSYKTDEADLEMVCKVSHRKYCHGFWTKEGNIAKQNYDTSSYIRDYQVVGVVKGEDEQGNLVIEQRNKFVLGDELEFMQPHGKDVHHILQEMYDEKGNAIESAPHAMMQVHIPMQEKLPPYSFVRKRITSPGVEK